MPDFIIPQAEALERLEVFEQFEQDEEWHDIPGTGRKRVHTFVQSGSMLLGADWDLEDVIAEMAKYPPQEAGTNATRMHHGIVLERPGKSSVFLATKERTQ